MDMNTQDELEKRKHKYRATAFLLGIGTISGLIGFSKTVAMAKKKDSHFFNKGVTGSIEMADTGVQLGN